MKNKTGTEKAALDNQTLISFWDQAFSMTEEAQTKARERGADGWKSLAPSEKLFQAAASLGTRSRVLDYGCGSAWAGIIAAKSGCPEVTAVDVAWGAVETARFHSRLYGTEEKVRILHVDPEWLRTVPDNSFDGLICSNVLDVVPDETARGILGEFARIAMPGAAVVIGLNYWLSPEEAARREMVLEEGRSLYVDGVLRLVSRTDEEWTELFSSLFEVENLEHFAWPGEKEERRRLFRLRKIA